MGTALGDRRPRRRDWPERAGRAAVALSGPEAREDDSYTARLLADIYSVFTSNGTRRYKTADLIAELCEIEESPWGDWYGKVITPQALSKLLRPHRIRTMPVKVEGQTVRGYKAEQFADAFHRVLGVTGVTSVTSGSGSQNEVTEGNAVTLSPKEGVTGNPASEAGSNASNAGNAKGTGEVPQLGDEMFPVLLANAVRGGHITEREAEARYALHRRIVGE